MANFKISCLLYVIAINLENYTIIDLILALKMRMGIDAYSPQEEIFFSNLLQIILRMPNIVKK